jgi:hypothetical protein
MTTGMVMMDIVPQGKPKKETAKKCLLNYIDEIYLKRRILSF